MSLPPTTTATAPSTFTFTPLVDKAFPSLQTHEVSDALKRWNLDVNSHCKTFRFDQPFSAEQSDAFLQDFFASPVVQEAAPVCSAPGQWSVLGNVGTGAVKYTKLSTTVLRTLFRNSARHG